MKRIFAILLLATVLMATALLCASCSKDGDSVDAAHSHTPGEAVVENVVEGSCTVDGSYSSCVYCVDCDKLLEVTVVTTSVACGQCTPGEPVVEENARPATCTADGGWYRVTSCTACGNVISEELIKDDPTKPVTRSEGHKWTGEDTYEIDATCTSHGGVYKAPKCEVCEELDYSSATLLYNTDQALGHDVSSGYHTEITQATCISDGKLEEVLSCDRCGVVLSVQLIKELPKSGHTNSDPVKENETSASCTKNGGYDEVTYCKICREETSRTHKEILASHTPGTAVKENYIFSDCEKGGSYDSVKYCTVCAAECERTKVTIDAAEHKKTTVTKTVEPATCTKDGKGVKVTLCLVCSTVFEEKQITIPASHTARTTTSTVHPTCEGSGKTTVTVTCTVCNETLSKTVTPISATGHSAGASHAENIINPTCTEDGSCDTVVRCLTCHKILSSTPKTIPATGHKHSTVLTENYHNKSVDGCYDLVVYCLNCGVELSRETVEHTPCDTVVEVHEDAVYCTTCDEELSRVVIGHEYVDKYCVRCCEYDFSEGLEFEISEDKTHWIVTGTGACTDGYVVIPREYTGTYTYVDSKTGKEVAVTETLAVTEIDRWAFYDCDSIERVLILKEITLIPDMAFYGCDNLVSITVEDGNDCYMSIDGNLYNADGSVLMQYAIGKSDAGFTMPSDVTEIKCGAFACNDALTSVSISANTTVIGANAFSFCTALETVVIPDGVTAIGEAAFADCHNLVSVTIGSAVESIEAGAFNSCTKLNSVTFNKTSGWKVSATEGGSKTAVSGLGDKAVAASYLTTTYMSYYWTGTAK